MAAAATTYDDVRKQIASGNLAPVYLLHGEEGFYTDRLVKLFENVIPEADREFDQYVVYAPETEPERVMGLCRRYPMMGPRQMVILKECQSVNANVINKLAPYVLNPSPTTTLVIVFRGADGKGKELMAAARKNGVVFQSPRVYANRIPALLTSIIAEQGLTVDPKALEMLADFIGTDLSRLYNEVDKLAFILGKGAKITPEAVERNIGISKDYNNFELVDAIAAKDLNKALRIAEYFKSNPKNNNLIPTAATLFNFFADMLVIFYSKDRSERGIMDTLNIRYSVQAKKFVTGLRYYNAFQVIECIWALRQFDANIKGNGSRRDQYEMFPELLYHLVTAPGNLGV